MENRFDTSFIPKKPSGGNKAKAKPRRASASDGTYLAIGIIVALIAGGAAGGLLYYKSSLEDRIESMITELEAARQEIASSTPSIAELERMGRKTTAAENLLENHIASSRIFDIISNSTAREIQYLNFSYALQGAENGASGGGQGSTGEENNEDSEARYPVLVTMSGEAPNFGVIEAQAGRYSEEEYIRDASFSQLAFKEGGGVSFRVELGLSAAAVAYGEEMESVSETESTPFTEDEGDDEARRAAQEEPRPDGGAAPEATPETPLSNFLLSEEAAL